MERKAVSGMMLTLLLTSMVSLAFNVQQVKSDWTWTETIYIRVDGSVDPDTAPISSVDNVTYTFTENIGDVPYWSSAIVVERDNIVVDGAGYTINGMGGGWGIDLSGRSNVTVKNTEIAGFQIGIFLIGSSNNMLFGNKITCVGAYEGMKTYSIYLYNSSSNSIIYNNIRGDPKYISYGIIAIGRSNGNSIAYNNVTENLSRGIVIFNSFDNSIFYNNLANNGKGVIAVNSNNNSIFQNNITNNEQGIRLEHSLGNDIAYNNIMLNVVGISFHICSDNSIFYNNIANNSLGIGLVNGSPNNTIAHNKITNNKRGIIISGRSNSNSIFYNNIANNSLGIGLNLRPWDNVIYHNNFINNKRQAYVDLTWGAWRADNVWDDGYPNGGNYWSDHTGVDIYSGLDQNETGSDGIVDTPYVINVNNTDNYPLTSPWPRDLTVVGVMPSATGVYVGHFVNITVVVRNGGITAETFDVTAYYNNTSIGTQTFVDLGAGENATLVFSWNTMDMALGNYTIKAEASVLPGETDTEDNTMISPLTMRIKLLGDVNGDNQVDIRDITTATLAFGSYLEHPKWNKQADVYQDNKVDIRDLVLIAKNFGKTYP